MDRVPSVVAPTLPQMERLKRRLDALPELLDAKGGTVTLLGAPAPEDVHGSLRLSGLLNLMAAHGLRLRSARHGRGDTPFLWLGGDTRPLSRLPVGRKLLLWPDPDAAPGPLTALLIARGGEAGWTLCGDRDAMGEETGIAKAGLPDPAHALWGLMEQLPAGDGMLRLDTPSRWRQPDAAGPGGLAKRLLRRSVGQMPALRRRRVLEAARQQVVAHAAIATPLIMPSVFATLLGRPVIAEDPGVLAYWRRWEVVPRLA